VGSVRKEIHLQATVERRRRRDVCSGLFQTWVAATGKASLPM